MVFSLIRQVLCLWVSGWGPLTEILVIPKDMSCPQLQARNFIAAKSVELRAFADKACHGDLRNLELEFVFLGRGHGETIGNPVFFLFERQTAFSVWKWEKMEVEETSEFCTSSWRKRTSNWISRRVHERTRPINVCWKYPCIKRR